MRRRRQELGAPGVRAARPGRSLRLGVLRTAIEPLEDRRLLSAVPHLVADINQAPVDTNGYFNYSSDAQRFNDLNGIAIFGADDGQHGLELWRSDGTQAGRT